MTETEGMTHEEAVSHLFPLEMQAVRDQVHKTLKPGIAVEYITILEKMLLEAVDENTGLEESLESAVGVAFRRGAKDWVKLNYPELYEKLMDQPRRQ